MRTRCLLCKAFIRGGQRSTYCRRCGAWNGDTGSSSMPPPGSPYGMQWIATTMDPVRIAYRWRH